VSDGHGGEDGREVLGQGSEPGRWASWSASRPRFAAALLLVAAAVGGYGANELLDDSAHTSPSPARQVVAGVLAETVDTNPAAMVVPLRNDSAVPVTVTDLHPEGWRAYGGEVTLPPGLWVDVRIWLTLECGRMPAPTKRLELRTAAGRDVPRRVTTATSLAMPDVPAALEELRHRLCQVPTGRRLEPRELQGTWLVEDARTYGGDLIVHVTGRRFTISSLHATRIDDVTLVVGRTEPAGRWLRLDAHGGWFCARGDSFVWQLGLLPDGRLRIGHVAYFGDVCQVDEREVWLARRFR
jgi:hypothetical protein